MSIKAMQWAFAQELPSARKFVLVALSDVANVQTGEAFPCLATIEAMTCLNRKTIIVSLDALEKDNLIVDTGKKAGRSGQVKVYKVNVPENFEACRPTVKAVSPVPKVELVPKTAPVPNLELSPSNPQEKPIIEPATSSKIGTSAENGTSAVFSGTSSKNGTGTSSKNGTRNPKVTQKEPGDLDAPANAGAPSGAELAKKSRKGEKRVVLTPEEEAEREEFIVDFRQAYNATYGVWPIAANSDRSKATQILRSAKTIGLSASEVVQLASDAFSLVNDLGVDMRDKFQCKRLHNIGYFLARFNEIRSEVMEAKAKAGKGGGFKAHAANADAYLSAPQNRDRPMTDEEKRRRVAEAIN